VQECIYVTDERGLWVAQRGGTETSGQYISGWDFEPVSLAPYGHAA
jgi:hypothetical protein